MIVKNYKVPTGNILIIKGEKGLLESVSLGDYGKDKNIKADFLGLTKDIDVVEHSDLMSLVEKWVVTISTQYGCSMNCTFCDVPKVGKGVNVTVDDLITQLSDSMSIHPEIEATKRLNVHFARMGEPSFNYNVLDFTRNYLRSTVKRFVGNSLIHPVISTMLPKDNKNLNNFLAEWVEIKNYNFRGAAGLQFSINSTDDLQRKVMFSNNSTNLEEISKIGQNLESPKGRKYTLNFALTLDTIVDAEKLRDLFDPKKFMVKITPIHMTKAITDNKIDVHRNYMQYNTYKKTEDALKKAGFDVIVFMPSLEEDQGRITCGNAILSGNMPVQYTEIV